MDERARALANRAFERVLGVSGHGRILAPHALPRFLPRVIGGAGYFLLVTVWLAYRRWFLLVILDLPGTIAV
jgi:hypothetical protein